MKKNILFLLFIGALAWAGTSTYNTTQRDAAVAITLGDTTNATHYASSILFTNGWTITAVSTGLVFAAP